MNKQIIIFILLALWSVILLMTAGCSHNTFNTNIETTITDTGSTKSENRFESTANEYNVEPSSEDGNIAIEEESLYFESIDELNQTIKEYKDNKEMQADHRYIYNKFEELTVDYNPTVDSEEYELMRIEVNPYRIFYYYVPVGAKSFEYSTGMVVTFTREKEATIETVRNQLNASYEPDGSFFYEQNRTWFIPLDGSYYSIRFPADIEYCDKSIVTLKTE